MSRLLTEAIRWSVFQTKNYGKAPKRSPTNRSRKVRLQSVKERTIKRTVCRCYSINQSNCRLLQSDQFTAPRLTAKSWIQTRSRHHAVQMSFAEKEAKGRFTRYDFCLRLSHAIFVARAARVIKKSYTISTISNCLSLRLS